MSDMKFISYGLLLVVFFPFHNADGHTLSSEQDELEVGLTFKDFDYREFSANANLLNRESGWLPGLMVAISEQYDKTSLRFEVAAYDGVVDYRGQTQGGSPITTRSDATIGEANFSMVHWLQAHTRLRLGVLADLGVYYWERNIRPASTATGAPVSGLYEEYRIAYGSLGMKMAYRMSEHTSWALEARASKILYADIEVDFLGTGGFDKTSLDLGKEYGYRIAFPWQYNLTPVSKVIVRPYYEFWRFGASEARELTINGAPSGTSILEPESETKNFGVTISYRANW